MKLFLLVGYDRVLGVFSSEAAAKEALEGAADRSPVFAPFLFIDERELDSLDRRETRHEMEFSLLS